MKNLNIILKIYQERTILETNNDYEETKIPNPSNRRSANDHWAKCNTEKLNFTLNTTQMF